MWPYWILFLIPAIGAVSAQPSQNLKPDGTRSAKFGALWTMIMIVIALMIGFRDRVGGDWYAYVRHLVNSELMTYAEAIYHSDPSYNILNVLSLRMGMGIVGVNLVCGFVFAFGLILYARSTPRPWLALAVAIPYMTVVVSMGYSRQGVALGFAMIGLVALGRQRLIWFLFWIFVAATFHRSAVVLVIIPILMMDFRSITRIPFLFVVGAVMYAALLEGKTDQFIEQYVEAEMQSDGAFIRLLMNVVPAVLLVLFRKRFDVQPSERKVYIIMSLLAIVSFGALVGGVLPSTALDRIGLYLIPLQVYVFANLPDALARFEGAKKGISFGIIIYYALVMFVWLQFANNSRFWTPYRMFPPFDIQEVYFMRRSDP